MEIEKQMFGWGKKKKKCAGPGKDRGIPRRILTHEFC